MIMMIIITIICNSITCLIMLLLMLAGSVFVYIFMYVHTNVGLIHLLHKKTNKRIDFTISILMKTLK